MARTYAPAADAQFDQWLATYAAALSTNYEAVGLASTDADAIEAARTLWEAKFSAHAASQAAARQGTRAKDAAREYAESVLSPQVARIQSYPGTTDELREALGLKPRGAGTSTAELPLEIAPKANLDINNKLSHEMVIQTDVTTGERRWKPAGTMGCEIYRKVGQTPTGPHDMQLVMTTAKSKVVLEYPDEDGGKMVHYLFRYVTRDGHAGPWSDVKSALIAA